jgi:hypothetical protein
MQTKLIPPIHYGTPVKIRSADDKTVPPASFLRKTIKPIFAITFEVMADCFTINQQSSAILATNRPMSNR